MEDSLELPESQCSPRFPPSALTSPMPPRTQESLAYSQSSQKCLPLQIPFASISNFDQLSPAPSQTNPPKIEKSTHLLNHLDKKHSEPTSRQRFTNGEQNISPNYPIAQLDEGRVKPMRKEKVQKALKNVIKSELAADLQIQPEPERPKFIQINSQAARTNPVNSQFKLPSCNHEGLLKSYERRVEKQEKIIEELQFTVAQQNQQIESLKEEKESLCSYIEEVKRKFNHSEATQLQQTEKSLAELRKQIENKAKQIQTMSRENEGLQKSLLDKEMVQSLLEMGYEQRTRELQESIDQVKRQNLRLKEHNERKTTLVAKATSPLKGEEPRQPSKQLKEEQIQTEVDEQVTYLRAELSLLKNERDHYHNQYRRKICEATQLYVLQAREKAYQKHLAQTAQEEPQQFIVQ